MVMFMKLIVRLDNKESWATKKLEIDDALNDRLITYSHGMRQR